MTKKLTKLQNIVQSLLSTSAPAPESSTLDASGSLPASFVSEAIPPTA